MNNKQLVSCEFCGDYYATVVHLDICISVILVTDSIVVILCDEVLRYGFSHR